MDFSIGLSGLKVAQQAMEVVSTNLANVATDGYHRQDLVIAPYVTDTVEGVAIGGSQITGVRQAVDKLLETEIRFQQPRYAQVQKELEGLSALEGAMGNLASDGLTGALNGFFGALRELATDPASQALREQAVWSADSLCAEFRNLGDLLGELIHHAEVEAQTLVNRLNSLAEEAAELNGEIQAASMRGGTANLLIDRRDQVILEMARIAEVTVHQATDGGETVNVQIWGTSMVFKNRSTSLGVTLTSDGQLGVVAEGASQVNIDARGGSLGGLLSLHNDILAGIGDDLDLLADQIARQINLLHAGAIGSAGSFDRLDGTTVLDAAETLSQWGAGVTAGTLHVRIIAPDGQVTVHSVDIDPDADTLATVAAKLGALDPAHLSAGVVGSALHLEGRAGYQFDFVPTSQLDLTSGPWTGTAEPECSGLYSGPANDTLMFTVSGSGRVGVDSGLTVQARNGAGELITTLQVGGGYAAGDRLEIQDGLYVSFGTGTLTDGESFGVDVLADSDTSGFLVAAGLNTLFYGAGARNIAVREEILANAGLLATSGDPNGTDNTVVSRMADVGDTATAALGNASPRDFHRLFVADVGQKIALRDARRLSLEGVLQQLDDQRERVSGVDLNEEAAKLLVFERMFQAMAKLIATQKEAMDTLVEML